MGPKRDPALDPVKQTAAKGITPGWSPTFAATQGTWQPREHAPTKGHLVLEICFRDPAQRPNGWKYAACVSWLEGNPRKDGQEGLPVMPTFQMLVHDAADDDDGKLRNLFILAVVVSPHRRRSQFHSSCDGQRYFLGESSTPRPKEPVRRTLTTTSADTTPKVTRWSPSCLFRLINCIIMLRDTYIEYFGSADRATVDARDVKGPWEAIAFVYNNIEANADVDENILPNDHYVTGHTTASDFFLLRHACNAADLEKHHNDMKAKINSAMVKKNKSGQGDNDAPAELENLVRLEGLSRNVDVEEDDIWDELELVVRARLYSNPTGNSIFNYVNGDVAMYYMWVLFEMYNLTRLINMRVSPCHRSGSGCYHDRARDLYCR
jgi:hypothetical protein